MRPLRPRAEGEQDEGSEPLPPTVPRTVISIGADAASDDSEDDTIKPLPDRLVTELTAFRTLALRDALANNPPVALTALLHTLCRDIFAHSFSTGCLQVSVRDVSFPVQAPDLKDSPPAKAIGERQAAWKADMPEDEDALWDWIAGLDDASRMALLAHCVSHGVNALYEKADRYGVGVSASSVRRRVAQADHLARAMSLDAVGGGLAPHGRELSRPGPESPHSGGCARGEGGAVGPAHRPSEESRHGERGRTAP